MIAFVASAFATDCGMAHVHDLPAADKAWLGLATAAPPPGLRMGGGGAGDKTINDTWGLGNRHETDNFVIHWGTYEGFSNTEMIALGEAFERTWDVTVDDLGYPAPRTSDTFKFNVYIGDTGGPDGLGAGGYFWYDDAGQPMIVIAAQTVAYGSSDITAAHEFFHAIQDAAGTYVYEGQGAWIYEASAVWIEEEVYTDDWTVVWFLPGFALLPDLPVNHFRYPSTGALEEYHQYGAFIFVRHLSDRYGIDFVKRVWTEASAGADPLRVIDALLAEHDTTVQAEFFDFAARNATWDYAQESWLESAIDGWGDWPEATHPTGFAEVPTDTKTPDDPPRTFGANYWRLTGVDPEFTVHFAADDPDASYAVAIQAQRGDEHLRIDVPIKAGGSGSLIVEDLHDADEVWLVVAAADTYVDFGETYSYRFSIESDFADEDDDNGWPSDDEEGFEAPENELVCGCQTAPTAPWIALLVALTAASRRPRWRSR